MLQECKRQEERADEEVKQFKWEQRQREEERATKMRFRAGCRLERIQNVAHMKWYGSVTVIATLVVVKTVKARAACVDGSVLITVGRD